MRLDDIQLKNVPHESPTRAAMQSLLKRAAIAVVLGFMVTACTVKYTYLKPGFEANELQKTKRLALLLIEPDALPEEAGQAFLSIARQELSHHNEFILYETKVGLESDSRELCNSQSRKPDAVLVHRITDLVKGEDSIELAVQALLLSCTDQTLLWEARGENTYPIEDDDLRVTIESYTNRHGEAARHYVAAFYLMGRKLYDSLPAPRLNDDDILEKIEMDAVSQRDERIALRNRQ